MIIKSAVTRDYFEKITTHSRFTEKILPHMTQHYTITIYLCINKRIQRDPDRLLRALRIFIISRSYIFATVPSPINSLHAKSGGKLFHIQNSSFTRTILWSNTIERCLQLYIPLCNNPLKTTAHQQSYFIIVQ